MLKLKWSKTIKIGYILYEAVDEYGETIKLCYPIDKNKQPQKGSHKLTYDNKTIKYINYDSKKIVDLIEKTHPVKNIKNSIVIAVWILSNFIECRKCLFMGVSWIL